MKRLQALLACVLGTGCVVGCTRTTIPEGPAPGTYVPEVPIRFNSVVFIDKSLQEQDFTSIEPAWLRLFVPPKPPRGKVAVESTGSRRTATGTLEVWAILRNRTDYPLQLEGKTHFFNASKVETEEPSEWKRIFLQPQAIATYREFSTSVRDVVYYYIEIREGK